MFFRLTQLRVIENIWNQRVPIFEFSFTYSFLESISRIGKFINCAIKSRIVFCKTFDVLFPEFFMSTNGLFYFVINDIKFVR